ncbi:MAG: zinc ribbon domain-containing protein [Firmicutes bacterium]|uniref:Uncharacterized protein n=1 Tax=Sulfobacillus benefaciens TaxID=453960 RepID=A0A2T2XA10_9FIRM|nr:zinc ribbon domain-containing protein [Bacillota bacterium]MCL5015391.1 zinc ribbon domain-containing protein [Bacillota bacterium]PSR31288.1 MAG: hypothetical protein C7B43_02660 [Sulfobacillus benefaciens]
MTCMRCGRDIDEIEAQFCPYCGAPQRQEQTAVRKPSPTGQWWRLLLPVLALIGSLSPWMKIMGPSHNTIALWNAYNLSPISWLWLVLDVAAAFMAAMWTSIRPGWWRSAWYLFGAVSFGVSTSGFIFVRVAAHVSSLLGAPSPLTLDYGLYLFTIITGLWTLLAWKESHHDTLASR